MAFRLYKESSEWVEFFKIFKDYFRLINRYGMMLLKHWNKISQLQVLTTFVRLAEFLVNLLYDAVGYHSPYIYRQP